MDKEIILVGGFHEMIELCEKAGFIIKGIIDDNLRESYYGYPVIGSDDDAESLFPEYGQYKVVLSPDSPKVRAKLEQLYSAIGYDYATVISPNATISKFATIGKGTVVQDFVNVSAGTKIGSFVKLNTYCNVMHDNIVGDFSTIAPNAVSLGRITIGKSSYIGANATILPGLSVGGNVTVGAGAVVTHNIPTNEIWAGCPASKLVNNKQSADNKPVISLMGGGRIVLPFYAAYNRIAA